MRRMMTTRRLLGLAAALLSLTASGSAQQQPAPPQPAPQEAAPEPSAQRPNQPAAQPTFRGGINYVAVDVIVTDRKDAPVLDIRREDFEVSEDGKPQTIEQFRLIRVDTVSASSEPPRRVRTRDDEQEQASREDVRVFAILLDDYHVRKRTAMSVREPLLKFLDSLSPHDLVAVMYPLTPVRDLMFTNNHASIAETIERFEGRKFDYTPRNRFEEEYFRASTADIERIRNDIVMDALSAIAVRMGSMREGRKSIVFVSEGLTVMLPPQLQRQNAQIPLDPVQAAAAATVQDSSQQQSAEFMNQATLDYKLRDVYRAVNRNNASIYALDPRGLAPFEFDIDEAPSGAAISLTADRRALQMTQDTLKGIAEQTDGRAIVNRNTLSEGLSQIVRDSSFYYLLGYNSAEAQTDGKFHEIKVRVKRSNVSVRARRGYWALTAADVKTLTTPTPDLAKPVAAALASISTSVQAGKYVRTWVGTERGDGGKTRVTLVWEPLTMPPGDRREPAGRVAWFAATSAGNIVFRGTSPQESGGGATAPGPSGTAAGPAAQRVVFDAAPGALELRMTVQGAGGGTLDQETRTITVPDLTAPQAALTTPRVFRARNAREYQVLVADDSAVPIAAREFSRTERLLVRFDAYAAGNEPAQPTAVLLNRGGQKMADVPVAAAQAGGTHQINLSLANIPAGEYLLEITVKSASGDAKELVPLRIGT